MGWRGRVFRRVGDGLSVVLIWLFSYCDILLFLFLFDDLMIDDWVFCFILFFVAVDLQLYFIVDEINRKLGIAV